MLKYIISFILIIFLSLVSHLALYSWGFFAHKKINRMAVFTLPPGMIGFYKKHIEFITENAVAPDRRRYSVEGEAEKHYIDIDYYGEKPFEVMPRRWKDAVEKFTEDTLRAYGIVPWNIEKEVGKLTNAFKDEDFNKILYLSANLGHYAAETYVPLHCSMNYNGQLTGQRGIHGFWESRLPELFSNNYDYFVGKAKYIESPLDHAWDAIEASIAAKDSILSFEAKLNAQYSTDKKYSHVTRGQMLIKTYSEEYCISYNKMLDGMVERRMRSSVLAVGSMWYTAWVNAGKPDLKRLEDREISKELKEQMKEEERMWKTGNPIGREHPD
ncbi:MAG: zinc dependent phospholipase C family protein [Bacteroidota bacterium]